MRNHCGTNRRKAKGLSRMILTEYNKDCESKKQRDPDDDFFFELLAEQHEND